VALAVAVMLWSGVQTTRQAIPHLPFYRLEAAAWLAEHAPPGAPDHDPQRRDRAVRRPAADRLSARILGANAGLRQARGATYLVVDEWEITEVRPYLAPLLDLARAAPLPGVTRVATFEQPGHTTMIFRLD
jgi:hypothetical protein